MRHRVILDVTGCSGRKTTGWERYATHLSAALESAVHSHPDLELLVAPGAPVAKSPLSYQARALANFTVGSYNTTSHLQAALYHTPTYPPGRVASSTKTIWTVHDDLILGGHSSYASRGTRAWAPIARRRLPHIDAIVTSTRAVAHEIISAGAKPERVHVFTPATPALASETSLPVLVDHMGQPTDIPAYFVLQVGTIEHRKRPDLSARAARRLGVPLVLVGSPRGINVVDLGPGVLHSVQTTDTQLSWLYQNAAALIAPSDYEGVDLPVFEAMSFGLGVCASAIAVHEELVTSAAHLFRPGSLISATTALEETLATPKPSPSHPLSSWAKLATDHLDLYSALCGRS